MCGCVQEEKEILCLQRTNIAGNPPTQLSARWRYNELCISQTLEVEFGSGWTWYHNSRGNIIHLWWRAATGPREHESTLPSWWRPTLFPSTQQNLKGILRHLASPACLPPIVQTHRRQDPSRSVGRGHSGQRLRWLSSTHLIQQKGVSCSVTCWRITYFLFSSDPREGTASSACVVELCDHVE